MNNNKQLNRFKYCFGPVYNDSLIIIKNKAKTFAFLKDDRDRKEIEEKQEFDVLIFEDTEAFWIDTPNQWLLGLEVDLFHELHVYKPGGHKTWIWLHDFGFLFDYD